MSVKSLLHCLHFLPELDGGRAGEGGDRRGGGTKVFKVMDNQFLSAELWGGTPDSEGDPSCSISALLHFHSLQPPVPEGVDKSIPTFGGGGAALSAVPALPLASATGDVSASVYIF